MTDSNRSDTQPDWTKLEGWDRTFAHMWEIAFKPELERRRASCMISDDFRVYMAQLLQPPEGGRKILFNEEVRGVALARTQRSVKKGEAVLMSDLEHIEQFDLPDDLLDCGHFTIIRSDERWLMAFNFLSGRAKARDMLELAAQFLDAAITSGAKGHAGPAVDNLFSASELVSKAELILHRSRAATAKSHGPVSSAINSWARLGNIDAAFVALFNKLGQQRPISRYGDREHRPSVPDVDSFDLVRAMIDRGMELVALSTDLAARPGASGKEQK